MTQSYACMVENIHILAHFEMLTRKNHIDAYGFKVPMKQYLPNKTKKQEYTTQL